MIERGDIRDNLPANARVRRAIVATLNEHNGEFKREELDLEDESTSTVTRILREMIMSDLLERDKIGHFVAAGPLEPLRNNGGDE